MQSAKDKIIVIAGPKGGVGRSSIALELGRSLSQLDRHVLLVDLDALGQGIAHVLDMPIQSMQSHVEFHAKPTSYPKLEVLHLGLRMDTLADSLASLRSTRYDYVILDLPPGLSELSLALMVQADLNILLANAEPASLFCATQSLRLTLHHAIAQNPEFHALIPALEPAKDSWRFESIQSTLAPSLQDVFLHALGRLRFGFVLNQRRENSELTQCEALCHAWGLELGITPYFLGTVGHDEKRWFFSRRIAPNTQYPREDSMVHDLNQLAKSVEQYLNHVPAPICLANLDVAESSRQFLLAPTTDELRPSYRRLWEGYRRENGLVSAVLSNERIEQTIELLDKALKIATKPEEEVLIATAPKLKTLSQDEQFLQRRDSGSFKALQAWKGENVPDNAGKILQDQRESHGLSLTELSLKSRIPRRIIENIENTNLESLEASYLKAYLLELAVILELEAEKLLQTFGFYQAKD